MPPRRSATARAPPCREHHADQAEIEQQEIVGDVFQHGLFGRRADLLRRQVFRLPFGAPAVGDHAASALIEAEHRQRRHQYGGGEQQRRRALVERLHPQPEIKPDAAMDPGDQQCREHLPAPVRRRHPKGIELLRIGLFLTEQRPAEPDAGDVGDDQGRDAQAEHELQRLDRLPVKLPALVQRPDAEPGVDQRRAVEHDRDRGKLPERGVVMDADSQRRHRDVAERMVEEMADQIAEQHQPAGQANLPGADAADGFCQRFPGKGGHAIQTNLHHR
jgi:hypothetical protein